MSNREGNIYEKIDGGGGNYSKGSIIIMTDDDDTKAPLFKLVKGSEVTRYYYKDDKHACNMFRLKQLYPEPVETINLMGTDYAKADVEKALATLAPIE